MDDARPRPGGARVVSIDRVADEVHLAGQVAVIRAVLGASGGQFAAVHGVGADGGADDARILGHRGERARIGGVGDEDLQAGEGRVAAGEVGLHLRELVAAPAGDRPAQGGRCLREVIGDQPAGEPARAEEHHLELAGSRGVHHLRHHPVIDSSNKWARSASSTGRGDSLVTRACGSVPFTSAGMSDLPYPTARSPFGTFRRCMIATSRSERIFPASSGLARETSAPRISAATRCRSGHACAVNRNTAGAFKITDIPCGTIGCVPGNPSGRKSFTIPETGYDIPCGRWTPALPNPPPAYDAASCIFSRASRSSGSSTARTKYFDTQRSASSDQMSLIGFDPWYAGRRIGRSGRGRFWKGRAVYDSMARLRTSKPLVAATCRGMLRVFSGSRIPSRGLRRRCAIPVFACSGV